MLRHLSLVIVALLSVAGCVEADSTPRHGTTLDNAWAALETAAQSAGPLDYCFPMYLAGCGPFEPCPYDTCQLARGFYDYSGEVGAPGVYRIEEVTLPDALPGSVRYRVSLVNGWTAGAPTSATLSFRLERPGCGSDFLRTFAKSVDVGSDIIVISGPPWEGFLSPFSLATAEGLFYRKPSGGYTNGHLFVDENVDLAAASELFATTFREVQAGQACSNVVVPDDRVDAPPSDDDEVPAEAYEIPGGTEGGPFDPNDPPTPGGE